MKPKAASSGRRTKRMGRPPRRPSVDEYSDTFLTFAQLGASLGQSYKQARLLVESNHIPVVRSGIKTTVHKEVARAIVDGSWWLTQKGEANNDNGEIRSDCAARWGEAIRQAAVS